ncbi:uncharacterized protein N7500_003805 [Penicillium coprophilum]|uniref:uncharacterized protein n=1 Tax=Penicillium coprophilum TaxID=36646 RepID=UPI00238361C2|nr:uncharacterized protein N7500_003805 [Penicillium coprophilum]KAJ5171022.1 hypothetical protein N7500_003805 [Penicillium coprophilum]
MTLSDEWYSDGARDGDDAEVGNSSKGDRNEGINRVHFEISRVIERVYIKAPNTMDRQNHAGGGLYKAVVEGG